MLKISKLDINLPLELVKTCAAMADSQLCKFVATNQDGEFQHSIEVKNKEDNVISLELSNLEIGYEDGRFVAQIMKVFQVFQGTMGGVQSYNTSQKDTPHDLPPRLPQNDVLNTGQIGTKARQPNVSNSVNELVEVNEGNTVGSHSIKNQNNPQVTSTPISSHSNTNRESITSELYSERRTVERSIPPIVSPVQLYKSVSSKRSATGSPMGQEMVTIKRPCHRADGTVTEVDIHETPGTHSDNSLSSDRKDIALETNILGSIDDAIEVKQELVDLEKEVSGYDAEGNESLDFSSTRPYWPQASLASSSQGASVLPNWHNSLDVSHGQDTPSTSTSCGVKNKNMTENTSSEARGKDKTINNRSIFWKCIKSILGHFGPIVYTRPLQQSLRVKAEELKDCMIYMETEGLGKCLQLGDRGTSIFVKKLPRDMATHCQQFGISPDVYTGKYFSWDMYILKTLPPKAKWRLIEKCRTELGKEYGDIVEDLYSPNKAHGPHSVENDA